MSKYNRQAQKTSEKTEMWHELKNVLPPNDDKIFFIVKNIGYVLIGYYDKENKEFVARTSGGNIRFKEENVKCWTEFPSMPSENNDERVIHITLTQAREWYKQGGELKKLALEGFTEGELTDEDYKNIKTMDDVINFLASTRNTCTFNPNTLKTTITSLKKQIDGVEFTSPRAGALLKLEMITEALNGADWKVKLYCGDLSDYYIPTFEIKNEKGFEEFYNNDGEKRFVGTFKNFNNNEIRYVILAKIPFKCSNLINFFKKGNINAGTYQNDSLIILACKNMNIAQHMGKYFASEIFKVLYNIDITPKNNFIS